MSMQNNEQKTLLKGFFFNFLVVHKMKLEISFNNGDLIKSDKEYKNICAWNIQNFERQEDGVLLNCGGIYGRFGMSEIEQIDLLITELELKKAKLENSNKEQIEISKEYFINKIYETDLIFNDLDLREFADEHLQNLLSFEENKENFLKFIEVAENESN